MVVINAWSKNKIRQVDGGLHIMLNLVTAYLCIIDPFSSEMRWMGLFNWLNYFNRDEI